MAKLDHPLFSPAVVAHRGGAHHWPENSREAFVGVGAHAVDAVECDVHLSACGAVVVVHDASLERTTTGRGHVGRSKLSSLRRAKVRGSDSPIPLLEELCEILAPTSAWLSLELKVDHKGERYPGLEDRVLEIVRAGPMARRTLMHSFDLETLAHLREAAPEMNLAGNICREEVEAAGGLLPAVDRVLACGVDRVNLNHELFPPDAEAIEVALAYIRVRGASPMVWTVNDDEALALWLASSVDAVTTDRPICALDRRDGIARPIAA
jgi:glycerophosphoryl diester phosphodiesterase